MTVSLILTEQIVKLFIILIIGFIMVRIGLLKVSDSKSISVLLVYLVLPCMIINSFQIEYTPEVLKGLIFTVVAAVIAHIVFLILTAILKRPLHLDMVEELTTVYTNAVFWLFRWSRRFLVQSMLFIPAVFWLCR